MSLNRLLPAALVGIAAVGSLVARPARAQTQQWAARYNPKQGDQTNTAVGIVVDGSGNVYTVGTAAGAPNGSNPTSTITTIKYNALGFQQWASRFSLNGFDQNAANAITLDAAGNVYVAGTATASGGGTAIVVLKYDPNGNQVLQNAFGGVGNTAQASAISVSANGGIYIAGSDANATSGRDYLIVKYSANGTEEWFASYTGPGNGTDIARAVTTDSNGFVYFTGTTQSGQGTQIATLKYNKDGRFQWQSLYNSPVNTIGSGNAIALDGNGNVYVAGAASGNGTGSDMVLLKYANNGGNEQWAARFNDAANGDDTALALAVDANGNAVVTGQSTGATTSGDIRTLKYDTNGQLQWNNGYNGSQNGNDLGAAVALDGAGNAVVAGRAGIGGNTSDAVVIKYNTAGNGVWAQRYRSAGTAAGAIGVAADANGNVYAAITAANSTVNTNTITTVKYAPYAWKIQSQGVAPDGSNRLLWTQWDGKVSLWTVPIGSATPTSTFEFGPYTDWTASAVAVSPTDGKVRILWNNVSGRISLWTLATNGTIENATEFGPFVSWTATAFSVGRDNAAHLVWNNADDRISLWKLTSAGSVATTTEFGPFVGWSAQGVATGSDGQARLLWNNVDGRSSLWTVGGNGSVTAREFGPYPGWFGAAVASGGTDGQTRLLWNNADGRASVWTIGANGALASTTEYGAYPNWAGSLLSVGPNDNKPRVLWYRLDGLSSLWRLNPNATALEQSLEFGPF